MQSNRDRGNFTPEGFPIAVPGDGSLGVPTVFAGTARDMRSPESMFRVDERLIVTEFNNLVIDSGQNFGVLDISEAGELHSVVVVADNPYLQVYLQVDDFRNAEPNGITVAELLYNGNLTQLAQRRFSAVDGQSPTVGYALVFEPQAPVKYTDRIRIILYNNIPSNDNVYGKDLNFRNSATLPTPAVPAHMAGSTFEQSSLASVGLGRVAMAMTTPVGSPAYYSGKTYNDAALDGQILSGMILGSDHPYVGIAGRPSFTSDPSCKFIAKERIGSGTRDAPHRFTVRDHSERFPGTSSEYSNMVASIRADVAEDGHFTETGSMTDASFNEMLGFGLELDGTNLQFDTASSFYPVGKRIFARVGGSVHMLGVCTAISATTNQEGSNEVIPSGGSSVIGKTTASTITGKSGTTPNIEYEPVDYHLKIEPGLAGNISDFSTEVLSGASASNGKTETSEFARWGIVTSQADTNPQILVKKIDVRRRKVYSKEG